MSATRRRQSLTSLLDTEPTPPPTPLTVTPEAQAPTVAEAVSEPDPTTAVAPPTPAPTAPAPRPARKPAVAPLPRYLQLERKEVRISSGQYDELTALARRLNRARPRGGTGKSGERITENTLIRVAIDLLLSKKPKLAGASEDELLRSVSS